MSLTHDEAAAEDHARKYGIFPLTEEEEKAVEDIWHFHDVVRHFFGTPWIKMPIVDHCKYFGVEENAIMGAIAELKLKTVSEICDEMEWVIERAKKWTLTLDEFESQPLATYQKAYHLL